MQDTNTRTEQPSAFRYVMTFTFALSAPIFWVIILTTYENRFVKFGLIVLFTFICLVFATAAWGIENTEAAA